MGKLLTAAARLLTRVSRGLDGGLEVEGARTSHAIEAQWRSGEAED